MRVVAALVRRGTTVMAARRAPGTRDAGLWEFPGGKVEAGEADEVALARELREELSIEVSVGRCVCETQVGNVHLLFYAATLNAGDPVGEEHDRVDWFDAEQVVGLSVPPPDAPALPAIADWLG